MEASITSSTQEFSNANPDETITEISLAADYYFNRELGLGAELQSNSGDDAGDEGLGLGINVSYFFDPNYFIQLSYQTFSADTSGEPDEVDRELAFSARF